MPTVEWARTQAERTPDGAGTVARKLFVALQLKLGERSFSVRRTSKLSEWRLGKNTSVLVRRNTVPCVLESVLAVMASAGREFPSRGRIGTPVVPAQQCRSAGTPINGKR
jgi:hypothetical protein